MFLANRLYLVAPSSQQDDRAGVPYENYPGLSNRSIFYSYSSVGNTFTFDVVQVTGSNLTSNVSCTETLARAHLKNTSPWFPR